MDSPLFEQVAGQDHGQSSTSARLRRRSRPAASARAPLWAATQPRALITP